jgi:hypothetical protein
MAAGDGPVADYLLGDVPAPLGALVGRAGGDEPWGFGGAVPVALGPVCVLEVMGWLVLYPPGAVCHPAGAVPVPTDVGPPPACAVPAVEVPLWRAVGAEPAAGCPDAFEATPSAIPTLMKPSPSTAAFVFMSTSFFPTRVKVVALER